ncbi:hypothetical protein RESH_01442 [Rhodopirellula europaea SH398]|uniref:Uncharacterized protein n=1 Tax=Rhodopirellula europaea SH398 TaxID=1263868 RepID=M5SJW7_9BACT|nr:hypothetical protein RESH_01442 [Rhodopirellula europaea SH398]
MRHAVSQLQSPASDFPPEQTSMAKPETLVWHDGDLAQATSRFESKQQ